MKKINPVIAVENMFRDEKEFFDYIKSHPQIGYGRMMQIISLYWKSLDPIGAFKVGDCYKGKD